MTAGRSRKSKSSARPPGETLAVGRIVRPHGVRGALVLEADSEALAALEPKRRVFLGEAAKPATVVACRRHGTRNLLMLEGIEDRKAAEAWRGAEVRIRLEDAPPLDEHTFYRWQVIGLRVVTEDGEDLGKVIQILSTGANDVYVVRGEREVLLPAIRDVVLSIDLAAGTMTVHLLPGLLE